MYNGQARDHGERPLPPGAFQPKSRSRQNSAQSGEATPVSVAAPQFLPYHRSVDTDLYDSIAQHLSYGSDRATESPAKPWVDATRDTSRRASTASSLGGASLADSAIISMYEDAASSSRHEQPYIPPQRKSSSSAVPSAAADSMLSSSQPPPHTSAQRITSSGYSPAISQGSIRRPSRPLPPTPGQRLPSNGSANRPLPSLQEGTASGSDWPPPPPGPARPSYGALEGLQRPNGRYSVDSQGRKMSSGSIYSPTYSPSSPSGDPFDPVTGRVQRKTSYDMSGPGFSTPPTSFDDDSMRRTVPTSSPPITSRSPSMTTLTPRTTVSSTRMSLQRNMSRKEEPVPPHLNPALLSHVAMFVKDRVPRAEHTRGAVPYHNSFTGQDLVNTIQRALPDALKADRRVGLQLARSLHGQLFFFDMRDNTGQLHDNLDGVYMFLDEEGSMLDFTQGSSKSSAIPLEELPTGVQTEVTQCYSPFCNRINAMGYSGGCYSHSCPNNKASGLKRADSTTSSMSTPTVLTSSDVPWVATVPTELLALLGDTEVKRQNEIHELINGESDYVRDIDILRTEFLEPLTDAEPAIIPSDEQSTFFAEVLLNAFEIREHASAFSEALQHRQREQGPVIQSIGDVVLAAATDWSSAYLQYATDYPFAEFRLKREQATNPAFEAFLNSFSRRINTRKLSMLHYQTRITVRLQRYLLLLDSIRKHTPEENPDRSAIAQAMAMLTDQCRRADEGVAVSNLRLACRQYERDLVEKPGSNYVKDLELGAEERSILQRGRMLRKPESSSLSDWTELYCILLDNYFIMTKPRAQGRQGETKYHISRRPIPLELLTVYSYEDGPVPRSTGFHLPRSNTESSVTSSRDDRMLWPITLQSLGRDFGIFTMYAESSKARDEWREKLQEALVARQTLLEASRVLEVTPLCQDAFFMRQHAHESATLRDGIRSIGRPTCSVAFQTPEGHQLVAIGHEEGLWIGLRHDPTSFRLVLHLKLITQCAVLQDFALVLVLADKALYAYPLEALVPSAASSAIQREKEPQRLSGTKDVLFFKAGRVGPRLLVIYVKKSGTQTVFKALEPIAPNDRSKATLLKRKPDWFRTYKDFFCPSETFSIGFMRTQLSIVCAKGFEMLSLENEPLKMSSFPDWGLVTRQDPRNAELAKRCSESRALAMFRLEDNEFLFVYEHLAMYADKHGDPMPSRYNDIIEWHGRPRNVTFVRPYLVAFDSNFMEIRHAHTGKLVQIIRTRETLCTFDGLVDGVGTGESERRPHVTFSERGRHCVGELVTVESRG